MIIHEIDEVTSTNDKVLQMLENGDAAPFWIIAKRQTSGRGRRGKLWQSLSGNLMASGAYSFEKHISSVLSFVVAIALKRTFEKYISPQRISLKWPNDIYISGKKISGILIEQSEILGRNNLIIGLGVNIALSPKHIDQETISLSEAIENDKKLPATKEFLIEFIAILQLCLDEYFLTGFENIRKEWLANAFGLQSRIKAMIGNNEVNGIFDTISDTGELILIDDFGTRIIINSGDVFFQH